MGSPAAYRMRVTAPRAAAQTLSAMLNEVHWPPPDAVGLFEVTPDLWQVDAYFQDEPDEAVLQAFLAGQEIDAGEITVEAVPEMDWVATVQAGLAPVHAGRFVIHGSHDRDKVKPGRWSIEIDAAQAFGTAHHGTTRGCLEVLDALAEGARFTRILDLGTGTGVLAIAAARLWEDAQVVASDIDPVATDIAAANVRQNGALQVQTVTADGLDEPAIRSGAPYDLVTANILARPLIDLAPSLAEITGPGGIVILSGFTSDQSGDVLAAYKAAGFTRRKVITLDDWVTLALERG